MGGRRLKITTQQPDGAFQLAGCGHHLPLHGESLPLPEPTSPGILLLDDESHRGGPLLGHLLPQVFPDGRSGSRTAPLGMKQQQTDVPLLRPRETSQQLHHPDQFMAELHANEAFLSAAHVRREGTKQLGCRFMATGLSFDALEEVAAGDAQALEALAISLREGPEGEC
nr:hypothetical protein [Cyanobium sp. Candia 9D4]